MATYRNEYVSRFSSDTVAVSFAQADSIGQIASTWAGRGGQWWECEDSAIRGFDFLFELNGVRFYGCK
jgi:hypothetical protein